MVSTVSGSSPAGCSVVVAVAALVATLVLVDGDVSMNDEVDDVVALVVSVRGALVIEESDVVAVLENVVG